MFVGFRLAIEVVAFEGVDWLQMPAALVEAGDGGLGEVVVLNYFQFLALHQSTMIALLGEHWTVGAGWWLEALMLVLLFLAGGPHCAAVEMVVGMLILPFETSEILSVSVLYCVVYLDAQ